MVYPVAKNGSCFKNDVATSSTINGKFPPCRILFEQLIVIRAWLSFKNAHLAWYSCLTMRWREYYFIKTTVWECLYIGHEISNFVFSVLALDRLSKNWKITEDIILISPEFIKKSLVFIQNDFLQLNILFVFLVRK